MKHRDFVCNVAYNLGNQNYIRSLVLLIRYYRHCYEVTSHVATHAITRFKSSRSVQPVANGLDDKGQKRLRHRLLFPISSHSRSQGETCQTRIENAREFSTDTRGLLFRVPRICIISSDHSHCSFIFERCILSHEFVLLLAYRTAFVQA